jgi:hypothetical protein
MRCNEEVTVPFATVALSTTDPIGKDFPKPLLPWLHMAAALMIDDAAIPRGWEYSICCWVENGTCRVTIPQSSRSIRNVGFLGPEDELVIVAPSTTMEYAWSKTETMPSETLQARVWWRSRLDGTRG